jgi:hypothetical protein
MAHGFTGLHCLATILKFSEKWDLKNFIICIAIPPFGTFVR